MGPLLTADHLMYTVNIERLEQEGMYRGSKRSFAFDPANLDDPDRDRTVVPFSTTASGFARVMRMIREHRDEELYGAERSLARAAQHVWLGDCSAVDLAFTERPEWLDFGTRALLELADDRISLSGPATGKLGEERRPVFGYLGPDLWFRTGALIRCFLRAKLSQEFGPPLFAVVKDHHGDPLKITVDLYVTPVYVDVEDIVI